jgi:phosphatidylglycerol---prolipoprotein diacylglyceryl transferase
MHLLFIDWNIDPTIIKIGTFEVRYYGLLFALGFIIGQRILVHIFKKEGKPESDVDNLTLYMVLATIIGARVGHYVFYEYPMISERSFGEWFLEMITPPFSGLASHGAGVGIFTALILYARKKADQPYLWVTDRMAITVAFAGFCIRMGNLMNSEIVGIPSQVSWAFNFLRNNEYLPIVPRHPAQLYEALSCLLLFFIMFAIWNKYKAQTPTGLLTGLFMIWVFTLRFFYEFLKENQTKYEADMIYNTGQLLSIPAVLFGIGCIVFGYLKDRQQKI